MAKRYKTTLVNGDDKVFQAIAKIAEFSKANLKGKVEKRSTLYPPQ